MATLHQLLKAMIDQGASDLHITAGTPPQLRIDGDLGRIETAGVTHLIDHSVSVPGFAVQAPDLDALAPTLPASVPPLHQEIDVEILVALDRPGLALHREDAVEVVLQDERLLRGVRGHL